MEIDGSNMKIITDTLRINNALNHAKDVLDLYQNGRGNFIINAIIMRDIEAVEQGDYSEIAIKRLEDAKYNK